MQHKFKFRIMHSGGIFKKWRAALKAEIINVGTELLLGHTINTNAALIARKLAELGVDLYSVRVAGDNPQRLEAAIREALENNDIVIASGGLGPTADDITKECAAKAAGLPLVESGEGLEQLKEFFGSRPPDAGQLKQAMAPRGSIILKNPNGSAPGWAVPVKDGKYIFLLPGPPRELEPMLENELAPFLKRFSDKIIKSSVLRCFGAGEGRAAQKLGELLELSNPTVATYAGDGEMLVKITAKAGSAEEAEKLMSPVISEANARLGAVVYGRDVSGLPERVTGLLKEKKLSAATAESCTGGLLAAKITSQPGASEIFHLGVVTYSNEEKTKILSVQKSTLESFGAVSPQTAEEMAIGIKKLAGADLGVSITGIAGPDGGSAEKPVGLVYIALAADKVYINKMEPFGRYLGRDWVRKRAVLTALDMMRRFLASLPVCSVFEI